MDTNETGQDPKLPQDARLSTLDERIERLQQAEARRTHKVEPDSSFRIGHQVLGHLVGAPLGGGLIGWGLDTLFGTSPWLLLLLLFLGFGVGIRNIVRVSKATPGPEPRQGS